jgi:S-adenosylmethionine hydrolase
MARRPTISLTTDFGLNDHFVGVMKGVILDVVPDAQIVDIAHAVQAFDLLDGALTIAQAYSYFPTGTVHLVVVDPGVGSARRPIILGTERYHFVAPDNGVLSLIYNQEQQIHVHQITAQHYFRTPVSNTFHGRDIFAPVAAYLAKGLDVGRFGQEIDDFVRFNTPKPRAISGNVLQGVVLKVDRFGNLITNIGPRDAPALFAVQPPTFQIQVGKGQITSLRTTYTDAAPGEAFAILGSMGFLEIAVNRASAAQILTAGKGSEVNLLFEGATSAAVAPGS